jgi:signal transduction histidine kinase/CheY-like chemotaxis protein
VRLRLASADDDSERQMAQIRALVTEGVDLLIVSPNQSHTITPAIEEAFDAGVPVILFDRKIDSDKYTAFIGADNVLIGRILGDYLADILGGKGRVVEIQGLRESSPAAERHKGFAEALEAHPGMELVASDYGDWLQEGGARVMSRWKDQGISFDAVFGQNDRMARGAWEALGRPEKLPLLGVDALPEGGLQDVLDGVLTATYIYPTRGDLVMKLAMDILSGNDYPRETMLESALVDSHNAAMVLMQEHEITDQREMVEKVSAQLDSSLSEYNTQRLVLYLLIGLTALLILLFAGSFYFYNRMRRFNTELERRNEELHLLSRKLEETTDAKLEFFTSVSHEFRTPLSLIAGPLEHVMGTSGLNPESRASLGIARENVDILLRLVNSILDFRKIENGKMPLRVSRFDLPVAVQQWMLGFKGRNLRYEGPESLMVEVDMHLTERVLFNLLSNAFKHTTAEDSIVVGIVPDGDKVRLSVTDTGEGIPADKLGLVFDRFYQAGDRSSGTGIGLALVKSIAQLHGGSVGVKSRVGEGTTFTVTLPLEQPGAEILEAEDAGKYREQFSSSYADSGPSRRESEQLELMTDTEDQRPTVLVVDDNESLRTFIASLLKDEYRVLLAADGKEALDVAGHQLPDLVISDVMMPVMDGLAFCQALKTQLATSHIPVILLTAKNMEDQRAEGYASGADAYISKPFSEKVLLSRVGNLLKSRLQLKHYYLENGTSDASEKENDFLSRFRSYAKKHLAEPDLNVEQLAAEIGLSRVQLYRKVKALTGYSPVEVIRIMRLKEAEKRLKSTDKTVAEIAYEVGFSSPSYFSKCYRELFGILPGTSR